MKELFTKVQKKHIIITIAVLMVTYTGYGYFFKKSTTTEAANQKVVNVVRTDLKQTIKALGKTTVVNEQKIRFNQLGKVAKVLVKEWDKVKKDQIIAELDQSDLSNTLEQSRISYENAKIALQELLNGNNESQILKSQNDVLAATNALELSKSELINLKSQADTKLLALSNTLKEQSLTQENSKADSSIYEQSNLTAVEQAKKEYEDKKRLYEIAKKDLENAKTLNTQSLSQAKSSYALKINNALLQVKNSLIEADTTLTAIDNMMGFTEQNKPKSASYSTYLSAKDASKKTDAQNYFDQANAKKIALVSAFEPIKNSNSETVDINTLIENLNQAESLFSSIIDLTDSSYKALTYSITATTFTDSQIESLKNEANSKRSSAQSRLSALITDATNISGLETPTMAENRLNIDLEKKAQNVDSTLLAMEKAESNYKELASGIGVKNTDKNISVLKWENSVATARKELEDAERSYATQIASKTNDIAQKENQLKIAKETLKEVERGATTLAIAKSKNDVEQKRLSYEQAKKNIEKYQIIAPFDGTIQSIDFKVWDNLVADDTKYVYIQNPNLIEVAVLLDQVDIIKVQPGMDVTMKFYAYPDDTFSGKISQIVGLPIEQSGVVSYQAKIVLDTKGKTFYSGMTQNVEIILSQKKNVLAVPSGALQWSGNNKYVQIQSSFSKPEKRTVKTGITNGTLTEIVNGLEEGEKIVERTFRVGTGSTNTQGSLIRIPGAGGGGGWNFRQAQ